MVPVVTRRQDGLERLGEAYERLKGSPETARSLAELCRRIAQASTDATERAAFVEACGLYLRREEPTDGSRH